MNDPYDSYAHGPAVEVAATHAPGGTDDLEDGSEAEAPPRRRSSIASGLGALVHPSREARFGLAALLSFLILVTALIMKREKAKAGEPDKTKASAKGDRRIPVARIHVTGPSPSESALAPTPEAFGPPAETPPVPPPVAESKPAELPIAPAPSEAEAVPAPMEPIPPAAAEKEKDKTPLLPPDLAAEPSEKPGVEAKDRSAAQSTSPADPVPAPSPSAAPAPGPATEASPTPASPSGPAPAAASTTLEILEPSPPAASGPTSSEVAPPTPESGAPAAVASPPAPAPSPIVDLSNPAAPTAPAASEPPAPVEPVDPPVASSATASPASPDPVANDAAPAPELPAPADSRIPPTSSAAEDPPAPPESQAGPAPEDAPAPELPAPADPRIPATSPPANSPEPVEAPARAEDVPKFAPPPEPAPPAVKPTENVSGGSLVTIPNVGKRRLFGRDLERLDPPADATIERPKAPDFDAVDRVESVPHVVRKGENFWTISRLSYGSGRFYKALWAANRHLVPVIDELYVDTTILIPPPEALDKSLILPAKTTRPARQAEPSSPVRRRSRSTFDEVPAEPEEIEVHLPTAPSSRRGSTSAEEVDLEPEVGGRPRLPVYKIRANETLRSIANHTLGDSHRADEILELNRTVIKDPNDLTTGQEIKLPADARVGRRAR